MWPKYEMWSVCDLNLRQMFSRSGLTDGLVAFHHFLTCNPKCDNLTISIEFCAYKESIKSPKYEGTNKNVLKSLAKDFSLFRKSSRQFGDDL
jgi:hypothetical protein